MDQEADNNTCIRDNLHNPSGINLLYFRIVWNRCAASFDGEFQSFDELQRISLMRIFLNLQNLLSLCVGSLVVELQIARRD